MKSLEDLGDYYNATLLPDLRDLERERQALKRQVGALAAAAAVAAVLIARFCRPHFILAALLLAGLAAAARVVYGFLTSDYDRDFKKKILPKLLAFIDPSLSYGPLGCVEVGVFEGSGLFSRWPDEYDGCDYISGKIGEVPFQLSEVRARYVATDSHGRKSLHPIFEGLFLAADFNKKLHGMTFVVPNAAARPRGELQRVVLEDADFNRLFVVYGTDQVEARYVLTPNLMRRLVKYATLSGERPCLSFVGERVHAAIRARESLSCPACSGRWSSSAPS